MADFVVEQLSIRLAAVRTAVSNARLSPDEEAVHQLRVSIRRLTEAMRSLEDWVAPRRAAKLKRRLRPIMKAAGVVRDLDMARWLSLKAPAPSAATAELLACQRTKAAHRLLKKLLALDLDNPRPPGQPKLSLPDPLVLATSIAADLVPRFWQADANAADLHPLRLETKHLRYSLELFAPFYGRGIAAKLNLLRRLQTHLGDMSDCNAALRFDIVRRDRPLCEWLAKRRESARRKFSGIWARACPGGAAWAGYFARQSE